MNSTVSFGSRTQGTIALSSGEAELYAIGQGTSEALYIRNLITEAKLAKSININIHTDSTAGKSMATRFGTRKKTKHVELRFLYGQELVGKGLIKLRKIGTKDNCADVLTKYLGTELLRSHLKKLCVFSTPLNSLNCDRTSRVSLLTERFFTGIPQGEVTACTLHTHTLYRYMYV